MSPTNPRKGSGRGRRPNVATETLEQFRSRAGGLDQSRISTASEALPIDSHVCRRDEIVYGRPRQEGTLPVQAVVDRAVPLTLPTFDVEVVDPDSGTLLETLRFPIFPPGRFGTDVNDPGYFSSLVDPRTSICAILDPVSALHCLARGGAW